MLKNYFKIAVRNLRRNGLISAINIIGLAAGLAACLLIVAYVRDETHYDRYAARSRDIYRVNLSVTGNVTAHYPMVDVAVGPGMAATYPEIEAFTRLGREIAIAAREGSNPDSNFKLRLAMDKARAQSMPKENVERAIRRGSGEDKEGVTFETMMYEGYGPHGSGILIQVVTDNRNRSVSEIRRVMTRSNGTMAEAGSVIHVRDRLLLGVARRNGKVVCVDLAQGKTVMLPENLPLLHIGAWRFMHKAPGGWETICEYRAPLSA